MEEKSMQFANFNITFGRQNEPMLTHFEDVLFPAFNSGYIRGKKDEYPRYSFSDIAISEIDGEYVLVGNFVKETEYKVITTVSHGSLVSTPADVPTAPYSRFLIFLKNHRMVLVKNENASPDIRSFQKTLREIVSKYLHAENQEREDKEKLPDAIINIIDIPLPESVETVLKDVKKIKWLRFRFFPLNNDLPVDPVFNLVTQSMGELGSRTANLVFNTPGSKDGVQSLLNATGGMAESTMQIEDNDGSSRKIKQDHFSSSVKVDYHGNLSANGDQYLAARAKKYGLVNWLSDENHKLYESFKEAIKRFVH